MNVEAMGLGCVSKCFLTTVWGFNQSLKGLVEEDTNCSTLKSSSELGRSGSLILTCSC